MRKVFLSSSSRDATVCNNVASCFFFIIQSRISTSVAEEPNVLFSIFSFLLLLPLLVLVFLLLVPGDFEEVDCELTLEKTLLAQCCQDGRV